MDFLKNIAKTKLADVNNYGLDEKSDDDSDDDGDDLDWI